MRNREDFSVFTSFVGHLQNAHGTTANDGSSLYRLREKNQHVGSIAITTQGVGNVTIIARIVHSSADQTINKQGAAVFVDFVFDGAVHRDFDYNVEIVGQAFASGYLFKAH